MGAHATIAGWRLRIGRPAPFGEPHAQHGQRGRGAGAAGPHRRGDRRRASLGPDRACRHRAPRGRRRHCAARLRHRAGGAADRRQRTGGAGAGHGARIDEVRAGLLPHEKVAAIKELQTLHGPVAGHGRRRHQRRAGAGDGGAGRGHRAR